MEVEPDYIIGRCQLALVAIKDGQLDEAKEWIEPVLQHPRLHISEFEMLCEAQVRYFTARKQREGADSWLQFWEHTSPNSSRLRATKLSISPMETLRESFRRL